MKYYFFVFLFGFLCVTLLSCKSSQKENDLTVKLTKSACFGQCPAYDIRVSQNRMVIFNGRKYTPVEGIIQVKLSEEKYKELSELVKESDFLTTKETTYERVLDVSNSTLEMKRGNYYKKERYYLQIPEKVKPLIKFLELLAIEIQSNSVRN